MTVIFDSLQPINTVVLNLQKLINSCSHESNGKVGSIELLVQFGQVRYHCVHFVLLNQIPVCSKMTIVFVSLEPVKSLTKPTHQLL